MVVIAVVVAVVSSHVKETDKSEIGVRIYLKKKKEEKRNANNCQWMAREKSSSHNEAKANHILKLTLMYTECIVIVVAVPLLFSHFQIEIFVAEMCCGCEHNQSIA